MFGRKPPKPRWKPPEFPPLPLNIGINELGGVPEPIKYNWFWRLHGRIRRIEYPDY